MSTLYVVATPIGNLEDISLRALKTLREVRLIAAEDTRKTGHLLTKYDIKTPMTSYYEHNKLAKMDYILGSAAEGDVALVSDAGTPGISDPGYELIQEAGRRGINVVPIPGASAIVTALTVSGLATDRFTSLGFLPRKSGGRRKLLESIAEDPGTLIVLETPHRLLEALEDIREVLGDRRLAVCRELTKLHEEIFRGSVTEAITHFTNPLGEFTIVIEGMKVAYPMEITDDIMNELRKLQLSGVKAKEAVTKVAEETGLTKKELYRAWLGRT